MQQENSYEDRRKRYLHYMEHVGMNEEWIETCVGELRVIIEALADYADLITPKIEKMEPTKKALWRERRARIKKAQRKLEGSIGYDRDEQIRICMKTRPKASEMDVGEDGLTMMIKKSMPKSGNKEEKGNV